MVRFLRVKRKGFTRKDGTRIAPTRFNIRDRGAPGRGPRVIPPLREGTLGGPGFFSKTQDVRRRREVMLAKRIGERKVQGKLQAIATFNKRTNPAVSRKAASDRRFIASSFVGKKRVKTGTGLSRR